MRAHGIILAGGILLLALSATACHKKDSGYRPPDEVKEIPRESAIDKLRELLPLSEEIICTAPKESLKQSDIREWIVTGDSIEIRPQKKQALVLNFADIRETPALQQSGKVFRVRIFTLNQKEPNKEHFEFHWKSQEHAQRMVDYLEAVRPKK